MAMTIDRFKQPALVVVDMQNDFVRVGAPLEVPTARDTIPAHRALIAECRRLGIPVIYTKFLAGPERTLIWQWSPVLAPPVRCCWKGVKRAYGDAAEMLECTEIIEELAPEPGDPIVEKFGYGSFHNTHLDDLLRARRVESVLITGTVTQICVDETARESFQRGYPTTIVSDAVSSYLPDLHDATLKNFALKFGWVSTSDEVITELRSRSDPVSRKHEPVPLRTEGGS
jgi:nicotinamidase-related amidase